MLDKNTSGRGARHPLQIIIALASGLVSATVVGWCQSSRNPEPRKRECELVPLRTGMMKPPRPWHIRAGEKYQRDPFVAFAVNSRGEVSEVKVLNGSGVRDIDAWVLRSVRRWKYKPVPRCGTQLVKMAVTIDFDAPAAVPLSTKK